MSNFNIFNFAYWKLSRQTRYGPRKCMVNWRQVFLESPVYSNRKAKCVKFHYYLGVRYKTQVVWPTVEYPVVNLYGRFCRGGYYIKSGNVFCRILEKIFSKAKVVCKSFSFEIHLISTKVQIMLYLIVFRYSTLGSRVKMVSKVRSRAYTWVYSPHKQRRLELKFAYNKLWWLTWVLDCHSSR